MNKQPWVYEAVVGMIILPTLLISAVVTPAQDLVPTGSLGGGGSIFVFRAVKQVVRRVAQVVKPTRSQAQQLESVRNIKRQYETIAKSKPQNGREKAVDPSQIAKSLPPAQAAKVFAGVGEYYLGRNEVDKSFEYFREAMRLDETNVSAKNGLAEAFATKGTDALEKGNLQTVATAKGFFEQSLQSNPNNIAANFGMAEVYTELGQEQDAIKSYETTLSINKDLTEIYVPLGILYYQTGEIAKADDMLSQAIAKKPDSSETQFFLGLVRTSQNKLDEALTAFQKAKTLDPNYEEAFFNSAETLEKLKRPADAIPDYQKATALRPNHFEAWLGLGQTLVEVGQAASDQKNDAEATAKFNQAIEAFKKAKSIKSNDWQIYAGLAEAYRRTGMFQDAAATYELAGLFYTQTKDFDKEIAADFYSKEGFAYGQQCPINRQKNIACQWPAAIVSLQKAIQLSNNPIDQANLGWAYYNAARGDLDLGDKVNGGQKLALAKEALEKAIAANPNQIVVDGALQNLGAVQNDLGDFAGAVKSLSGVAERHPDWTFSQYALATAYFLTGDYNNAAKWFNTVLTKQPDFVAALSGLGNTQLKLKNGKELKRIIDLLRPLAPTEANKLEIEAKVARVKIG